MEAIQASGDTKLIGLSSFRTVFASARPQNWISPASITILVKLESFPLEGGFRQKERNKTPPTMSFAGASSLICIIGLKVVSILAFGE